jgi:hypothetical protein
MRKFYSEPTMDVNVFDVENIVTESTGTPTEVDQIDDGYAKVTIGYQDFNIVF